MVLEEIEKDFTSAFVALSYVNVCRDIFAKLCREGDIDFTPSRIGSYWLNDYAGDTKIDVMAVDQQNKRLFASECKYHVKPVDAPVYFSLKEKMEKHTQIQKAFPNYEVVYGVFSKSGFTQRLMDTARENPTLMLVSEDSVVRL